MSLFDGKNKNTIEKRCEMISNHTFYNKTKVGLAITIIALLLFVGSYFVILQPAYSPPTEDMDGELDITSENAYIIYADESFQLYVNNQYLCEIPKENIKDMPYSYLKIIEEGGAK